MARTGCKPCNALKNWHAVELIEHFLVLRVVLEVLWAWLTPPMGDAALQSHEGTPAVRLSFALW